MAASVGFVDFFRLHRRITLALSGVVISSAIILPACGDGGLTDTGPTDLSISKTGVVSGQTVTYTITVSNNGSSATQATVSDVVSSAPPGSQFTTVPAGICTPATGIAYSCTTLNISPGGTAVLTFVLTVPPGLSGDVRNCASIPADASSSDNQSCVTNTVIAPPATGRITIIKVAQPKTPQDFAFTSSKPAITAFLLDDDSDATLPNQREFTGVAADTYVITETPVAGWTLAGIECSPASAATTSLATGAATIVLAGGASVGCTFTNVAVSPVITAVTPDSITNSSSAQPVTLTGTGFVEGANIVLRNPNTVFANLTASSFSSTQIVFDHTFPLNPAPQDWSVEVINPAGTTTGQRSFTVAPAIPVLTSLTISPAAPTTADEITLTLTGSDFLVTQANIVITGPGCEPACTVLNSALSTKTETTLVGSLRLTSAGTFAVFIQNTIIGQSFEPGGGTPRERSNIMPFDVTSPPPPILVSPANGEVVRSDAITFTWETSSDGPYKIKIVEIIGDQSPEEAVLRNKAFFEREDIRQRTFQYDAAAPKFSGGKKYGWVVTAGGVQSRASTFDRGGNTAAISGITPASPVGSAHTATVTVTVSNFMTGANITLRNLTTSETFENIPPVSVSGMDVVIEPVFGIATTTQRWSLAVINPGAPSSNEFEFEVRAPTPVIEKLTTSEPETGRVVLTVTGRNFSDVAAHVLVEGPGCAPACTIPNGELTTKTHSMLVGTLSLTGQGTFTVRVQNGAPGPGGPGGPSSDGVIFVRGAQPVIVEGITPASPVGSARPQLLTVTGSNFGTGADVTLRNVTTAETFARIQPTSLSGTQIVIEPVLGIATTTQNWSLVVNNPGGASSAEFGFEVRAPTPVITALTTVRKAGGKGEPEYLELTITGNNFSAGAARINVIPLNDPPIAIENSELTEKSATRLVGQVTLTKPGTYTVTVQNGAGEAGGRAPPTSNAVTFETVWDDTDIVHVLSITPTSPVGSASPGTFTVTGTNFLAGANVTLRNISTSETFADISPVSMSATQIVIAPVLGIATTTQNWSLVVKNPGGVSSAEFGFEVQAPTPAIRSISTNPSPAVTAGAGGRTNVITLVGTEFSDVAARVLITGPGCEPCTIENSAFTTKSATTLVASMSFSRAGTFSVIVQNAGSSPVGLTGPQSAPITLVVVE